jgi:hypothetical protein
MWDVAAYMGKNDWNSLFEVKGSYASREFAQRSGHPARPWAFYLAVKLQPPAPQSVRAGI